MPLVWAHAEYVKLLRSATDKRVFDRVDAVAERYATPRARGTIEVWRRDRQVARMEARRRLRVEAEECFRAALERGWLEDGGDDAGNRGGLLRLLRRCGAGSRGAAGVHAVLAVARAVGGPELLRDCGAVSGCAGRAGLRSD